MSSKSSLSSSPSPVSDAISENTVAAVPRSSSSMKVPNSDSISKVISLSDSEASEE